MPEKSHSPQPPEHQHQEQPIVTAGAPVKVAEAVVIMLHGRGSTARAILRHIDELYHHGVMYLAPQAARNRWYPHSGYAPFERNEPWFSSALERVSAAVEEATAVGIAPEKILYFGFSQGACLGCEFVARNPQKYGGLVSLSGSLLGPETRGDYDNSLDGTSVFFGCGMDDPYIPAKRIHESKQVFEQRGGDVTVSLYDDLEHAINDDEIHQTNSLIEQIV